MTRPLAGSIVVVDWRSGALPKEPTKIRPAIVIEETTLFPDEYPNILVVPLTTDQGLAHPTFAEPLRPTAANGMPAPSWALSHHATSVSLRRVKTTDSTVTPAELAGIRSRLALSIGIE